MARQVLIVTSSYQPALIADMHRARHLAWELPKVNWITDILSPGEEFQRGEVVDRQSADLFAPETTLHFVSPRASGLFRALGFGSIGWRALVPMYFAGMRILRSKKVDVVYLSTTQFPLFLLGLAWHRRTGVPFILDVHDPIFKEGKTHPVWGRPSAKYAINRWLAKQIEAASVKAASGLISVSPKYIEELKRRYGKYSPTWMVQGRATVIPFGFLDRDLAIAAGRNCRTLRGSTIRICYVGAGGPIMRRSFTLICKALAHVKAIQPQSVEGVRIELFGTMMGWKLGDACDMAAVASSFGLSDVVSEDPRRIPYLRSLELLHDSDAAIILGVEDEGYMPSKLYPYARTGKPLLAALHRRSPAFVEFEKNPELGLALWFEDDGEMPISEAAAIVADFLVQARKRLLIDRTKLVEPHTARSSAQRHVLMFEACAVGE